MRIIEVYMLCKHTVVLNYTSWMGWSKLKIEREVWLGGWLVLWLVF